MSLTSEAKPGRIDCRLALLIAAGHFCVAFLVWAAICVGFFCTPWSELGQGSSVLLALLAGGTGMAVRVLGRPLLRNEKPASGQRNDLSAFEKAVEQICSSPTQCDLWAMLLGFMATFNWLGFIALKSDSLWQALPACGTLLVFEALTLKWFNHCHPGLSRYLSLSKLLPWIRPEAFSGEPTQSSDAIVDPKSRETQFSESPAAPLVDGSTLAGSSLGKGQAEAEDPSESQECSLHRQTQCEGIAEDGNRYFQGEVQVEFEEGQRLFETFVGFCPPFAGAPDLELESSDPDFSATVVRVTPQGAQLQVRRSNVEGSARMEVAWYACESQAAMKSGPTQQILP